MTETIRFYKSKDAHGYMSNLYPARTAVWGRTFLTSEHAYQFRKPVDPEVAEWIAAAPDGKCAALAGHGLFKNQIRADWDDVKIGIMRDVVLAKFEQNHHLLTQLLATGDAILVEASPVDSFWGEGPKGTGKNWLGVILIEVRETLRANIMPR